MVITALLSTGIFYCLKIEDEKRIQSIKETSGDGVSQSFNVVLIIEHYRESNLIYRLEKDDDLILRNVAGMFHYAIKGTDAETSYYYKLADGSLGSVGGVTSSLAQIRIGTGTTTPAYADWKLQTQVYADKIEELVYSDSVLEMNATFYTTFNIVSSYAITEAGLSSGLAPHDYLLFRDTFTAINVISGDLLTVKYVVMFN